MTSEYKIRELTNAAEHRLRVRAVKNCLGAMAGDQGFVADVLASRPALFVVLWLRALPTHSSRQVYSIDLFGSDIVLDVASESTTAPKVGGEFVVKAGSVDHLQSIDGIRCKVTSVPPNSKTFTASVNGQEWYLETFLWGTHLVPVDPQAPALTLVAQQHPTDPSDAEIARLKSELERTKAFFFDPSIGHSGERVPVKDYRFEKAVHCDRLREIATKLGLVDDGESLVLSLIENLPKRFAPPVKGSAMDGRTLGDALGTVATQRARIRALETEEQIRECADEHRRLGAAEFWAKFRAAARDVRRAA